MNNNNPKHGGRWRGMLAIGLIGLLAGCATTPPPDPAAQRAEGLRNVRATYCAAVRGPDRRVAVEQLVAQLVDSGANTYSFCIHTEPTDWEDLRRLLPVARAKGIRVWASILPPSESIPRGKHYSEPYRMDYVRWAEAFARLSLEHPNLVAWSIDDFTHNVKDTFTPDLVRQMLAAAQRINPRLAFVPCCYYPGINAEFAANYAPLLDGVLFPYRAESGKANLRDPGRVETEVANIRTLIGGRPIILDIYATAHSRLGDTTADYVDTVMQAAHRFADGVMIYRHQDPVANADKYQVVKRNFTSWAAETRH